ncbi:MAG: substrate-binding domain-containing protein [Anaerolineae bacterium]|nr:substrate-binding domain-containing protein [Anaerolineae bacterium]
METLNTTFPSPNSTITRPTIGFFTSGLADQYSYSILNGAITAAEKQNANLVVYSGGELDSPVSDRIYDNVIYDLVDVSTIDALILLTGTLVGFAGPERRAAFFDRYTMTKVSIGVALPNASNVMLDNDVGMRLAIKHLIDVHRLNRIAFIQGPEGNEEANQRFQVYLETLAANSIPFDPELVVQGQFQTEDGIEAIRILMDERKVGFNAIVGANDNMAIGALNELLRRNVPVPRQVAVVGFDDTDDAQALVPSLTTVRQPLYEQGKYAVELALARLRHEEVRNPLVLNTNLIIRQSCGCFSRVAIDHRTTDNFSADKGTLERIWADLRSLNISRLLSGGSSARDDHWIEQIYTSFLEDLATDPPTDSIGNLAITLDSLTHALMLDHAPVAEWQDILDAMRREVTPMLGTHLDLRRRAKNLWQQGRNIISDAIQHAEANKQLQTKIQAQALTEIGEALLTVTNVEDLSRAMSENLPSLDVISCYIATYEDASREWSTLIYLYDRESHQSHSLPKHNQVRFPTNTILLPNNRRFTLLVESLHFGDVQIGFVVLEVENAHAYIYDALRKQISNALHTVSLMQQLEEKHTLLEKTLADLKTTQSMLVHSEKMNALGQMVAGVAHEINNPIAFVNSNVHSMGQTLEEIVSAYNTLETFTRSVLPPEQLPNVDKIRQDSDLDFLVDDTKDMVEQTMGGLKRVKNIVQELRKFSRLDEAEHKLVNLRENIDSTLLVASGQLRNRIEVEVNVDPTLELRCAPAELNQVFLNIIINAAQAIEGTGTITITAQETPLDVTIEIADTGSGIPASVIDHIFDPFFTTKPVGVGTGLGLSISHKIIVDGHKGAISARSEPGKGTTFTIKLPKDSTA